MTSPEPPNHRLSNAASAPEPFQRVGWVTLAILGVLTLVVLLVDYVAGLLGAKRVGASGHALAGAAIGTVVGMFFGLVGLLVGPFTSAFAGEVIARGRLAPAARVGRDNWIGVVASVLVKLAIVLAMLGVLVTSHAIGCVEWIARTFPWLFNMACCPLSSARCTLRKRPRHAGGLRAVLHLQIQSCRFLLVRLAGCGAGRDR